MRALVGLLALALLSGCVRGDERDPYSEPLESGRGGLGIIVQDDRQERVANATVLVMPSGEYGRTDDVGLFVARDLVPGEYSVTVNADGYHDGRNEEPCVATADAYSECVVHVDRRQRR